MGGPIYFEIQANDPERAMAFYHDVFGWEFTKFDKAPVPYWRIHTGGIEGGLLQRPADAPPPECGTNAFVCSIEVVDFDAVANHILAKGGQVALPKFPIPGNGWQGYFLDAEGNTFGIFQVDPDAK